MAVTVVGSFPLGTINLAAAGSVGVIAPLLGQLDSLLFSPFGLGGAQADVSAQFNAALQANIQIGVQILNPLAAIELTLSSIANISAALTASVALPIPSVQLTAQLAASIAITGVIGVKLAAIQVLMSAALALKNPAVDFLANLTANLGAGPVVVASWGYASPPTTLSQTGIDISSLFSGGVSGIAPGDAVYGVLLVTKSVSASVGISSTLLVM